MTKKTTMFIGSYLLRCPPNLLFPTDSYTSVTPPVVVPFVVIIVLIASVALVVLVGSILSGRIIIIGSFDGWWGGGGLVSGGICKIFPSNRLKYATI